MLQFLVLLCALPVSAKVIVRSAPVGVRTAPTLLVPVGLKVGGLETSLVIPSLSVPTASALPSLLPVQRSGQTAQAAPAAIPAPAPKFARAARALPLLTPPNAQELKSAPAESLKTASLSFFAVNAAAPEEMPVSGVVRSARNKTSRLIHHYKQVRAVEAGALPKRAFRYRYLLVPGLAYDAIPDYMEPNLGRLQDLGLDVEMVQTRPYGDPTSNAEIIAKRIRASDKPVVLITHSKGGIDSLEALEREKGVAGKISRFVAIQSPYYGSAMADWFTNNAIIMSLTLGWLRTIRVASIWNTPFPWVSRAAVIKISKRFRGSLPDARPKGARKRTRFYSVVSRIEGGASSVSWPLWAKAGFMKMLSGKNNDGLVVPEDAVYPDSDYAWLEDVGHVDTIADDRSWKARTFGVRGQDEPFAAILTEAIVRWIHEPRQKAPR
ncbi:MAG: hypothetical protein COB53_05820 [Elusimicrobia bacterium]|nr:MAG: hypothetical protein COB53_05820 [Elusimicrobiota bacterium]